MAHAISFGAGEMNSKQTKKYIGLSRCEMHIEEGCTSDPLLRKTLGLLGVCSHGQGVPLLSCGGKVEQEREGPFPVGWSRRA